ncbi:MAG TPA: acyltransferase family protein [Vicinamibacterales bacterium]|nr:acyltransferase family protein [Vicinamibacterales bacterium]
MGTRDIEQARLSTARSAGPTAVVLATPSKADRSTFRPDIEGLRAIAILQVVAYHALIPGVSGGYVGVDVFFVLSGFLITGLLVREIDQTGALDLARFYARRARRLLPAVAVVLVVTIVASAIILSPYEQRSISTSATSTAAYVSNLYFAKWSTDYLNNRREGNPFLHTWSLSVEEQFYLIWPVFVMYALSVLPWQHRKALGHRRLLWFMTAAAVVSFAMSDFLTVTHQPWAFFSSPTRAWEFAVGALAMLVSREQVSANRMSSSSELVSWLGLSGLLAATTLFGRTTLFPGNAALLPALSTALILWATTQNPQGSVVRILRTRPLQGIGRLSYSWYLWHWPVIILGSAILVTPSLLARVSLALLSLVPAVISYRLVEDPIRHNRWLTSKNRYSITMAGVLAVFLVGVSVMWTLTSDWASQLASQIRYTSAVSDGPRRLSQRNGCTAEFADVQANPCDFGDEHSPDTLVLIGDSYAAQWFPAFDLIASRRHWHLVTLIKVSCALAEVTPFDERVGRYYTECTEWRQRAIAYIRQNRPALTIMTSLNDYVLGDEEWQAGITKVVDAIASASDSVLILKDTPTGGFDMPSCLARRAWHPSFVPSPSCEFPLNDPATSRIFDFQQSAATRHANVVASDVSSRLCPDGVCSGEIEKFLVYRDAHHITASAALWLKPALEAEIERALAAGRAAAGVSRIPEPPNHGH